jgi:hypothetical protein
MRSLLEMLLLLGWDPRRLNQGAISREVATAITGIIDRLPEGKLDEMSFQGTEY